MSNQQFSTQLNQQTTIPSITQQGSQQQESKKPDSVSEKQQTQSEEIKAQPDFKNESSSNTPINQLPKKTIQESEDNPKDESNVEKFAKISNIQKYTDEKHVYKMIKKMSDQLQMKKIWKPTNNKAIVKFVTKDDCATFLNLCKIDKNFMKKYRVKLCEKQDIATKKRVFDVKYIEKKIQEQKEQQFQINTEDKNKQEEIMGTIQDQVCPYYKTEYSEQIEKKKAEFMKMLQNWKDVAKKQIQQGDILPKWLESDLPCELTEFLQCDAENRFYYRNKAEFTIGYNMKGEVTVGFNRGNFSKGVIYVESAEDCPIVSKESIQIAQALQNYIIECKIPVYDRIKSSGVWKYLIVRQSNVNKSILINIVWYTKDLTAEQIDKTKQDILNLFLKKIELKDFKVVSLSLQYAEGIGEGVKPSDKIELLHGNTFFIETILNKQFKVSANAFLQVNTVQCNKLYSLLGEILKSTGQLNKNTIFLDICSGIGTIGMCLADQCEQVIGIEMVETACKDSEENAKLNNIKNYKTICSKVEDVIDNVVKEYAGKANIIGIVDPPRGGLHKDVVKALRSCRQLKHLIYVACSPNSIIDNLNYLCLPEKKNRKGEQFHPIKCYCVDLFPQTIHFEGVFYLQKY